MTDTAQKTTVTISVDGKSVEAQPGEMIIAAAERAGVYIPRFCYHPRMKPVGMCRMCLVEVDGPRGPALVPSCFLPVAEGQTVTTNSPRVKKAQDGVLEFLLINHPLDCPVCDKGGECPLQDQTYAYGPGESRFVEEKRHWEKPISLSDLVLLDRERCIQCSRCTRFADEIAGDALIEFINRGERTEVNVFPDEPFASYFSGNTVQICPVGALTSVPYRFKARPWDLEQSESTCTTCSVGCRMSTQSTQNSMVRHMGIDSDLVNQGWLCDKGRYNFGTSNSESRLRTPTAKKGNDFIEISWAEAIEDVVAKVKDTIDGSGVGKIGFIGGARLSNEDIYSWVRLAKGVIGTDNVDAQLNDGLPAELVLGLPQATIDDACRASQIVLLAPDLKEELPVLYLRLRQAVVDKGVDLLEISSRRTGLTKYASKVVSYAPGDAAVTVQKLISDGTINSDAVVIIGRPSLAESSLCIEESAGLLKAMPGVRFLPVLRRGNVRGALELGMSPGILPGRMSLNDGHEWFAGKWGQAPAEMGMNSIEMLRAAAAGELRVLFLVGADPLVDFPDSELVTKALQNTDYVVAVQAHPSASLEYANVVLPTTTFGERGGTTTNIEGRVTRLSPKVTPPGQAWSDWQIASEIASGLGSDSSSISIEAIAKDIYNCVPSWLAITEDALRADPDGLLINSQRADAPQIEFKASSTATPAPRLDQYKLRLISSRVLYDNAQNVTTSDISRLSVELSMHVNSAELSRMGVDNGAKVTVRTQGGQSALIPVSTDDSVPKGCAWMPFATEISGVRTNAFLTSDAVVNDVVVESQR